MHHGAEQCTRSLLSPARPPTAQSRMLPTTRRRLDRNVAVHAATRPQDGTSQAQAVPKSLPSTEPEPSGASDKAGSGSANGSEDSGLLGADDERDLQKVFDDLSSLIEERIGDVQDSAKRESLSRALDEVREEANIIRHKPVTQRLRPLRQLETRSIEALRIVQETTVGPLYGNDAQRVSRIVTDLRTLAQHTRPPNKAFNDALEGFQETIRNPSNHSKMRTVAQAVRGLFTAAFVNFRPRMGPDQEKLVIELHKTVIDFIQHRCTREECHQMVCSRCNCWSSIQC